MAEKSIARQSRTGPPLEKLSVVPKFAQQHVRIDGGLCFVMGDLELFRHVDPNDYMWTGDGLRSVRANIGFETPLERPPMVFLSVLSIDSSHAHNLRYTLKTENVTRYSFEIVMETWYDTKIASARVNWLAMSQSQESRLQSIVKSNTPQRQA